MQVISVRMQESDVLISDFLFEWRFLEEQLSKFEYNYTAELLLKQQK